MEIFLNNSPIYSIENMEDIVATGTIIFDFFDYNLDGIMDFRVPISCGKSIYYKYYIFNSLKNTFEHVQSWDYLRIFKINIKEKKIVRYPDGNYDTEKIYQIKGLGLIKL